MPSHVGGVRSGFYIFLRKGGIIMDEIGEISANEFLWDLTEDLGDILTVERMCPGVYYVCAQGGTQPGTEFYAVAKNTRLCSLEG